MKLPVHLVLQTDANAVLVSNISYYLSFIFSGG